MSCGADRFSENPGVLLNSKVRSRFESPVLRHGQPIDTIPEDKYFPLLLFWKCKGLRTSRCIDSLQLTDGTQNRRQDTV